ncbi:hypothetical protein ABPG75_009164 [Micractinium tetrahymenae]
MGVFKQLVPASEPALAAELVSLLSQSLSQEGMANYFTRRNEQAAARLWQELLHLLLAAAAPAASPQLFHLADGSAAALVQQYPQDRAGWHRGSSLLRLAKLAPWGKWRALREALVALDKQKAAFHSSHGPFLHLAAVAVAPQLRSAGLGSVLLDHICRAADQQRRPVYVEVTSDRVRGWFKRHGFAETMRHSVRPHAPPVYVLVRWPAAAAGAGNGAAAGGGGNGAQQQQQQQQQQAPRLRPAGSVRSR